MEIADWDNGSVILHGLSDDMNPARVREAIESRLITPASENFIRPLFKQMVVYLYNHQKTTPVFQAKVSNGKNTLAYFLCAMHEQPPTQGRKPERPKLRTARQLPLTEWDSLYYALVAEVRALYNDLKELFGNDFGHGTIVLHHFGENGTSSGNEPFTALRLAAELENFWKELMDNRLVAALDVAVREKHVAENITKNHEKGYSVGGVYASTVEGLLDVNAMTYDDIMSVLWTERAPEIERKAIEDGSCQTLLSVCRAEVREAGSSRSSAESPCSDNIHCKCNNDCDCRMDCNFQKNECSCAHVRSQVQELVDDNLKLSRGVRHGLGPSAAFPEHLFGTMCNEIAQMTVATLAAPDPYTLQATKNAYQDAAVQDAELLEQHRERASTKDSAIADIPYPKTPKHDRKEVYPLGFYGDISDHRYPALRPNVQNRPPPMFTAPAFANDQTPVRKPIPTSTSPSSVPSMPLPAPTGPLPLPPSAFPATRIRPGEQVLTPSTSPLDAQSFAQADQVTYSAMPISCSQTRFTSSLPAPVSRSRFRPDIDRTVTAEAYVNLAQEAHAAVSPYAEDPPHSPSPLQASYRRRFVSSSPPDITSATNARENRDALASLEPPLPPRDYVSPRLALKQRYVSAGGHARLEDRAEIPGPAFINSGSGATIDKEELFSRLSDPDFIRQNFGEYALKLSMERNSQGVEIGSNRVSGRTNTLPEAGEAQEVHGEKRERKESNTSTGSGGRFSKLKRVFSRKSSEHEAE